MNKSIFCDLDETLVQSTAFLDARREFAELMTTEGFTFEESDSLMEKIDSTAAHSLGFGDKHRFANSMGETYQELCRLYNKPTKFKILEDARDIGISAMARPSSIMTGVIDTLKEVKALGYQVYIVTKGNVIVQETKIKSTKLDKLVDGWFVFEHKTIVEMYKVLEATKSAARLSYFVGNSPKSDVNPAYMAGLNAVYVPHPNTWVAELEPVLDGVVSIDSISQLKDVLV